MEFKRSDLVRSVQALVASTDASERSIGFNYLIEENVGSLRQHHLENFDTSVGEVRALVDGYYRDTVEGLVRGHLPSTFDRTLNSAALLPASVEPNQKIVRLERIDGLLRGGAPEFARLEEAARTRDPDELSVLTDMFAAFRGERPAFAAFKSEVERDLAQPDWLQCLIDRLGLLHYYPYDPRLTYSFALMEYTAAEVFSRAKRLSIDQCFAIGTVLECRNNPAFFPVPRGSAQGFAVDLRDRAAPLPLLREILHIRIDYNWDHLKRLAQWTGADQPDIEGARARHRAILRKDTGRTDFGDVVR